jgi:hypothetical protein
MRETDQLLYNHQSYAISLLECEEITQRRDHIQTDRCDLFVAQCYTTTPYTTGPKIQPAQTLHRRSPDRGPSYESLKANKYVRLGMHGAWKRLVLIFLSLSTHSNFSLPACFSSVTCDACAATC